MASRPDWAETLIENSGAATGLNVQCPGGTIAFIFQGTVTDVDINLISTVSGSDVVIPITAQLLPLFINKNIES